MRRVVVIAGHYGSGKTELAVSLAMRLSAQGEKEYPRLAMVDLDIANPYFRSRERMQLLREHGVSMYADTFESTGTTAELPALTAALRAPLEDEGCRTIIDLGGNDAGARVLRQFRKYFESGEHELWAVVNFRRYETLTVETARQHVDAIAAELQLPVDGLVNNTHLLRETTPEILRQGYALARRLSEETGVPLLYNCYPAGVIRPEEIAELPRLMPLGLYMRPAYLDK